MCTSAAPWFRNLVVKDMPNLVGMAARPRLRWAERPLKAAAAARRASKSELRSTCARAAETREEESRWAAASEAGHHWEGSVAAAAASGVRCCVGSSARNSGRARAAATRLAPALPQPAVRQRLAVVRGVPFGVHVQRAHLVGGAAHRPRDLLHPHFGDQHALRAAEAAEGGVGRLVGPVSRGRARGRRVMRERERWRVSRRRRRRQVCGRARRGGGGGGRRRRLAATRQPRAADLHRCPATRMTGMR